MQEEKPEAPASNVVTLEMIKQVHTTQVAGLNDNRRTQILAVREHEGIGGKENIEESVLTVVRMFPDGVRNEHLKMGFPDAELATARISLVAKGLITQSGKRGDDVIIKPVLKPAGAEAVAK